MNAVASAGDVRGLVAPIDLADVSLGMLLGRLLAVLAVARPGLAVAVAVLAVGAVVAEGAVRGRLLVVGAGVPVGALLGLARSPDERVGRRGGGVAVGVLVTALRVDLEGARRSLSGGGRGG